MKKGEGEGAVRHHCKAYTTWCKKDLHLHFLPSRVIVTLGPQRASRLTFSPSVRSLTNAYPLSLLYLDAR